MRLLKIKVTKDKKISIIYEEQNKKGQWDKFSMECNEEPLPTFYSALYQLGEHVISLCELPKNYEGKIAVKGVTLSYGGEKEVMGATIIASMKLMHSNCDLNLVTPHKASESYSDGPCDEKQILSDGCVLAINKLCGEAELYIRGDRSQIDMFKQAEMAV